MDKNETLSKIYNLKSRLGMIVLINQQIETNQKEFKYLKENERIEASRISSRSHEEAENYLDNIKNAYLNSMMSQERIANNAFQKVMYEERYIENNQKKRKMIYKIILAILIFLLMSFLLLFLFMSMLMSGSQSGYNMITLLSSMINQEYFTSAMIILFMYVVVSIQIIVSTILKLNFKYIHQSEIEYKRKYEMKKGELQSEYNEKISMIRSSAKYLELVKKGKENSERQIKDLYLKTDRLAKRIKELIILKKEIYKQTHSQYDSFIHPLDWQYLDLIVYLFETGRANEIKEALNEIDHWVRHNQLITTINQMGNQIEQALRQGFRRLEQHINNRLNTIEQRVNYMGQFINHRLDLMESQLTVLNQEKIDAIEGLRFAMTKSSSDLSKQANDAYHNINHQLSLIEQNSR